ncbi:polysaccharide deacetylase family protein [Herbidospora mongoliensis]|uniref:polysaccharide deacetylase family protein n=1 Tax=Herbidospora mongoliensis TaxID=688067 RepID=UPI000A4D9CCC|nr:polysaccharide deacetylase family protein [Herbidospora mongoliensis]
MIDNTDPDGGRRKRPSAIRKALVIAALGVLSASLAVVLSTPAGAANCSGGYVGLTYDDGPNAGNTTTLLNALRQNGLRATMFNVGQNAQNNQALVRAQRDAGMWIANHSYTHPHMTSMSQSQMQSEIQRTQTAIQQATGTAPTLFRPPYGETNATLKAVQQQLGLREIIWDVDSQDWNGASTAQIAQRAGGLQNGQIILMHDQYATTVAAIPQIAQTLTSRNMCAGMISASTGRAVAPDDGPSPSPSPSASPSASPSPSPSTSPSTTFRLRNEGAGRCVDSPNSASANGTLFQIYDCHTNPNQRFTHTSGRQLQILGKCLDSPTNAGSGTRVQLWDCHTNTNQQWNFNSNGTVTNGANNLCLAVTGTANSSTVTVASCNGSANQRWTRA